MIKHKKLFKVLITSGIVMVAFSIWWYYFFHTMSRLPQGEFLRESTSPNGIYTVKLYIIDPPLSVYGIRGEVVNNKTGKKRNIYWENGRYLFEAGILSDEITWESDEIVVINGRTLNVLKDAYDCRDNPY